MMSLHKKIAMAGLGVGVALLVTPAIGYSATNHLPVGTRVDAKLQSGTDMIFHGQIDGEAIVVTCKSFTASGTIPKGNVYKMKLTHPPAITGCTDDLGGHDTITTNSTNGRWSLSVNRTSPYTLTLTIPKAGSTFESSLLGNSCVVTVAPTAAVPVAGSYNATTGYDTVSGASIATTGTGCTSKPAKTYATVVLTPNPGAPPF